MNIGKGRNGKGVFMFVLEHILGDYAMTANFDSFTARVGNGGIELRSDIARLEGARYVGASEAEEGAKLAEALIKNLTGSDRITARKHYEGERSYTPQFKLWFGVNHKPKIYGVDDGIWSRIHQIVWGVFIKPEERIKNLREILQAEAPGILNWMLEGWQDYQKNGLVPSAKMKAALQEFREESDQLGQFLQEYCVFDPNLRVQSST